MFSKTKLFPVFLIGLFCLNFLSFCAPAAQASFPLPSGVTVYCWDYCENLGTWNETGWALDASNYAQGNHSLNFQAHYTTAANSSEIDSFPNGTSTVLGAWMYMPIGNPTDFNPYGKLTLYNAAGNDYMGFQLAYSAPNWGIYGFAEGDGSVYQYKLCDYSLGDWVWVEAKWNHTNSQYWRVNGSNLHGLSGEDVDLYEGGTAPIFYADCAPFNANHRIDFVRIADEFEFPPTELDVTVTADLENVDDYAADWVFTEWRYYTFTATIPATFYIDALDLVAMRFTLETYNGSVACGVWKDGSDQWNFDCSPAIESRTLEPIRIKAGTYTDDGSQSMITFPIWFTQTCLDIYEQIDAIDVEMAWNDTTGAYVDWAVIESGFFRIYNKGGFCQNTTTSGTAYGLQGDTTFALYAENSSYVYRDWWFRDVQHMKLLPEIQCIAGYQTFWLRYGIDVSYGDGEWIHTYQVTIEPDAVSWSGIFAANVWVNMTVSWLNRGIADVKTEDYDYMFYHGEAGAAGQYVRWRLWLDQWFDSLNASSAIGARINAYEYPMKDDSAVWLRWLSSNWGVKDDVSKESMALVPLLDAAGNIVSSEKVVMIKFWTELEVPSDPDYNQKVTVGNFDVIDLTKSKTLPLDGIQTPVFDETKMPVMTNTGILGAIWSMLSGLGQWISDNILFGGLALWPTFVAFLDMIAGWLGMSNGFSNFITWLGTGWTWLVNSFTYALTAVANIFIFLAQGLGSFFWAIGQAIASFVTVLASIASWIGGGVSGVVNLWDTLGLATWFTIGLIFYPLYLIILWDTKGLDAVMHQLGMIWGILSWLAHFFMAVINLIINLIGRIIESIPVVE